LVAHPTPDREVGSSILSGLTLFIIFYFPITNDLSYSNSLIYVSLKHFI